MTFSQNVAAFWEWYTGVAARFHATIEDGRCGDLSAGEVWFPMKS